MRARFLTMAMMALALGAASPAAAEEWIELNPQPTATRVPYQGGPKAAQLLNAGQIDAAIREYEIWVEADPQNVDAHARLAELYGRQRRWDRAAKVAEAGARVDSKHPDVLTIWGHALTRLRRYPDAVYVLESLIRTNAAKSLHQPYYDLAKSCYEMKWYTRSVEYALRHLQVGPSPQGHALLARTYLRMGQKDKALAEMHKSVVRYEPFEDGVR